MTRRRGALAAFAALALVAGFLAWEGRVVLDSLFDGGDSSDATYLSVGCTAHALSALAAAGALLALRPSRLARVWLAAVLLPAAAFPYDSLLGPGGFALNAALAVGTAAAGRLAVA